MALKLLYPLLASQDDDVAVNVVIVPGIGLPRPQDWKNSSGRWLKDIQEAHGERVRIWNYNYEAVKGQSILQSLLQQSHVLPTALHQLNPRDSPRRFILIVCQSLGGYIWKQAYANMLEKRHENDNVLDYIHGTVFLGTPHVEELQQLDFNIVEIIVRASAAPFSFLSFTPEDNRSITQISRRFSGFAGPVISTFETIESKYRAVKWKGSISRSRLIVPKELATLPSNPSAKLYGVMSSHENLCKIKVDGDLFKSISGLLGAAVSKHRPPSTSHAVSDQSEMHTEGSILDGWDVQSLRSHRSRITKPVTIASSNNVSNAGDDQEEDQNWLSPPNLGSPLNSRTPSASAAYSSQFSYEIIPSFKNLELEKPKLIIPCFSVGLRTRKDPFFGRDNILHSIDKSLLPEANPSSIDEDSIDSFTNLKTFALCGAGGIGKTELASEYVFSRKLRFLAIFWVTADSRNRLLEEFARVAVDLGLQAKTESQDVAEACELVKGWLCSPVKDLESPLDSPNNEVPWLLVFDNVDDWGEIEDFWPNTGIGSILITSRDPLSRSHIYSAKHGLDLNPFSSSESLEFLDAMSQNSFKGSLASAQAVARWAGGLPLIIAAIASTMSTQNLTYNAMLDLLKIQGFEAVATETKPQDHTVQTVSIASMIGLACLDEQTQSLIQVISYLNPEGVPQRLLINKSGRAKLPSFPKDYASLNHAQSKLQQASLITFHESTQTIHMHRIFQDIVREFLSPEVRVEALLTALDLVSESWVFSSLEHRFDTTRYETCSIVFPHVDRLFQHYEEMFKSRKIDASEQAARLFNNAGWYWFERGLPQESKPFCRLTQNICETLQQSRPSEIVAEMLRESHNNQGSAANETNYPQESLEHNLMWLSLMHERRSSDDREMVDYELGCVYNEVGVAYAMNGKYNLALDFFNQSMFTYKSLPEYDEKWLGWPLPNIGMVHWIQGNYKSALKALHRIRQIYVDAYGPDDRQSFKTGKILYGIGNIHLSLGDLDSALEYHLRCLNQWLETLGPGHHRIGDVSHKIAQDFIGQGQFDKAQEYLSRALRIFARRPYHKHEHARTTFRQGQLHLARGRVDLAEQSFKAAHKQRQGLVSHDTRPWDELLEKDYDELVIFMSR